MGAEQVVKASIDHRRRSEVHAQAVDGQFFPAHPTDAAQVQAQGRAGVGYAGQRLRFVAIKQHGFGYRQWPEGGIGGAAEMNAGAAVGCDKQRGVAWQAIPFAEVALGRVRLELDDGAGRQRTQRQGV
ncbi:hypothetical protein D9M68_551750 [compost metagenome]